MVVNQYDIYLVKLSPTIGHEIKKTRPCVILSPDDLNREIKTVIVAPLTSKSHHFSWRIPLVLNKRSGFVVLDQIRTVDLKRLVKKVGKLNISTVMRVKAAIKEMLID
ncbi:MAG: type II toxin-antitoxin system PemK/MazF family toxin [Patescibacteria group bacterium]